MQNFSRKKHSGQSRVLFLLRLRHPVLSRNLTALLFRTGMLFTCHLFFLLFDHFLDHISAYRSVLLGGKVTVVAVR